MKVAIIGTAPASRAVAPFNDPTWAIWACSQGNYGQLPRVDIWFELHALNFFQSPEAAYMRPYLDWLKAQTFPVYMQEPNDFVPEARVYPLREMIAKFGRNWFSSSVTYMIALAISQGAEEIGLFGVDMAADQEHYTGQRAGCWRFFEIAKDRGIKITVPHESCLGEPPPLYAYSEATRMGRKLQIRRAEMEKLLGELTAQRDHLNGEIAYIRGALETNNYMLRTFVDGADAELDLPAPAAAGDGFGPYEQTEAGVLIPMTGRRKEG